MRKVIYKFLLSAFALLAFTATHAQTIWDGTTNTDWYNTSDSVFTITSAEDLAGLAQLVNGGNDFRNKTIVLGADILLNDTAGWEGKITDASWDAAGVLTTPSIVSTGLNKWNPIGSQDNLFNGVFDGNNKTIAGMYIEDDMIDAGFFGGTGSASTIKNIEIEKSFVKAVLSTTWGDAPRVGGLIGYSESILVRNCDIDVLVSAHVTVAGAPYCGGLIGETSKDGDSPKITNCRAYGDVFAYSAHNSAVVGGLVGYLDVEVKNCGATGNIYASSDDTHYRTSQAGGLIGYISYTSVANSYALGDVVSKKGNARVGGLVGQLRGSSGKVVIDNSYSVGTVSYENEGDSVSLAGGSVGEIYSGELRNCYYNGDVNTDGGLGKGTPAEMPTSKTVTEMLSADFVELLITGRNKNWPWEHNAGINNGYPYQIPPSTDATLATLAVSEGTLSPAFSAGVTAYTVSVANSVEEITITATATDANAVVSGDTATHILTVGTNTFTVTVAAEDGETTKNYTITVTRADKVGLVDIKATDIKVYPNPVVDMLYIESPVAVQAVVVYDITGAIVLSQNNIGNSVDVSKLPQGVYVAKFVTSRGEVIRKIVK